MSTEVGAPRIEPSTSFDSLKQINAGELNVGYADAGPADGPAILLLHGWPYDIHSYVEVAPLLAENEEDEVNVVLSEVEDEAPAANTMAAKASAGAPAQVASTPKPRSATPRWP